MIVISQLVLKLMQMDRKQLATLISQVDGEIWSMQATKEYESAGGFPYLSVEYSTGKRMCKYQRKPFGKETQEEFEERISQSVENKIAACNQRIADLKVIRKYSVQVAELKRKI